MNRRALLAAVPAALVARSASVRAQSLATVRTNGAPSDAYKAVFYGIRSGIFRKYGLNVETTMVNSGAAGAAALVGGATDVALTNITVVITAHTRGVPMQSLVPAAVHTSDASFTKTLVLKDSPIHTGRDLNGKVVGSISLGSTIAAGIQAWIDKTGGDARTVKLIEVPVTGSIEILEAGRVAAIAINEPTVAQALATGNIRVLFDPNDIVGNRFQAGSFNVMEPAAAKNADAMWRFAQAMHESQVYTNHHLAETVDLVAGYSGITPEVVARSVRIIDPLFVEAANLQPVIDILAKYGITDRTFPAQEIISPFALKPRRGDARL